jgi:catechol 2,3-dioxygenase-like lactoylglutathione lyase family enzyme
VTSHTETSRDVPEAPARRFLHICYCCADTDAVVDFYVQALGLREVMRNPLHPSDGSLLGIEGEIVSGASFLYDSRGARTSSSIEVQEWVKPSMVGEPISDPTRVGMQAIGFAVADLDAAIERITERGGKLLGRGRSPWVTSWATLADPFGTRIDVLGDPLVPVDEVRMRHLRITVTDLEASVSWYHGLGFLDVDTHELRAADFLGLNSDSDINVEVRRLRLPDERCELVLTQWKSPTSHGRHPVEANHAGLFRTAVSVDDTRRSYDEFREAGWVFEREPRQVELEGTNVPDMWICFLNDPDGVPFEFVQRPRDAFRDRD